MLIFALITLNSSTLYNHIKPYGGMGYIRYITHPTIWLLVHLVEHRMYSLCVLKVTPDIGMVRVNTHTVVYRMFGNMQEQGLFVVTVPLVIIPHCQKIIDKVLRDPFFKT